MCLVMNSLFIILLWVLYEFSYELWFKYSMSCIVSFIYLNYVYVYGFLTSIMVFYYVRVSVFINEGFYKLGSIVYDNGMWMVYGVVFMGVLWIVGV